MDESNLVGLTAAQLTDMGICPTCFNRAHNGCVFGDDSDKVVYRDNDIEVFFAGNPRADGHMCISTIKHFQDMAQAPDEINIKIALFSKRLMNVLCDVFGCVRVYLCTMCDGAANHFHVQLIPRYADEPRGSGNFVKPRKQYIYDEEKFNAVKSAVALFSAEL